MTLTLLCLAFDSSSQGHMLGSFSSFVFVPKFLFTELNCCSVNAVWKLKASLKPSISHWMPWLLMQSSGLILNLSSTKEIYDQVWFFLGFFCSTGRNQSSDAQMSLFTLAGINHCTYSAMKTNHLPARCPSTAVAVEIKM